MAYAGCQPGYSAQAHFKPRAIICNGRLLAQKKTEAAVELDGLANRVLYLGQRRVHL